MPSFSALVTPLVKKGVRMALLVAVFMLMAGGGAYLALTLIIKAEDTVVVPDLVGKDVIYGLEILSDLGLNTRIKATSYHARVPKNHIIDQQPEAGAAIKPGRDVKIRVSRGPKTILMPNLAGLSLQQSRILLTENGLCLNMITRIPSSRNRIDQVMAQFPSPGATVSRNTCADLLISQGPSAPAFAMPALTGLTLASAIGRLEQLQLKLGRIRVTHTPAAAQETIVGQTPLAGYRVHMESPVDLTVNRLKTARLGDNHPTRDNVKLFRYALEYGFLKKRVQVKMNQAQMSLSLFDEWVTPGQEVWLLVPKDANPTILVYVDGRLVETQIVDDR